MLSIIKKTGLLFFVITALLSSCLKEKEYPVIPEIEFQTFLTIRNEQDIDERGVLIFSFKDGDGDIGLSEEQTESPYDYNLFIKYFEMQNGELTEVLPTFYNPNTGIYDTITFNSRIPMLTPEGRIKAIKGTVRDTIFIYNPTSQFDTICFEAYIKDRELHESNVIKTPLIIIKK
ncbi:MAG: hypothetical protein U9R32_10475 [Bacteroidota bacterium]|nr:hypothetical protein [Bacteroidota bacterium]